MAKGPRPNLAPSYPTARRPATISNRHNIARMTSCERYYAAACQIDLPNPRTREEIPARVRRMVEMIDHAVLGYEPFFPVRLVVFPEFAHAAPIYHTVAELQKLLALPIPNEFTAMYHRKARERGVYIQTGTFLEVDPRW